jgi:excisionase family DNA binding protein
MLTIGQAAQLLGVDVSSLRRWARQGKITFVRTPGGHRRFLRSELELLAGLEQPSRGVLE